MFLIPANQHAILYIKTHRLSNRSGCYTWHCWAFCLLCLIFWLSDFSYYLGVFSSFLAISFYVFLAVCLNLLPVSSVWTCLLICLCLLCVYLYNLFYSKCILLQTFFHNDVLTFSHRAYSCVETLKNFLKKSLNLQPPSKIC